MKNRPASFSDAIENLKSEVPALSVRPQQERLAHLINHTLAQEEPTQLLAEAGTGVGKSLGALIPAILNRTGTVVVSTATKALQSQYASTDLPLLERSLGEPFSWAQLKGRSSYVCRAQLAQASIPQAAELVEELLSSPGHSGDRDEVATQLSDAEWSEVSISTDDCTSKRCKFYDSCFAERARKKAMNADVIVVNHALLLTDAKIKAVTLTAGVLPKYETLVIDEAHELPEWATNALTDEMTYGGVQRVVSNALSMLREHTQLEESFILAHQDRIMSALMEVWEALPEDNQRLFIEYFFQHLDAYEALIKGLTTLVEGLDDIRIRPEDDSDGRARHYLERTRKALSNYVSRFRLLCTAEESARVRWVEVSTYRGNEVKKLKSAPIAVDGFLRETLWRDSHVVLMSATLSVGRSFDYMVRELGLTHYIAEDVGTPFDYQHQAKLFLPAASDPNPKDKDAWQAYYADTAMQLVQAAGGGALLLFTSRAAMNQALGSMRRRIERQGLTVLVQGEAPNQQLAARFKEDTHSVLFALKSFFTGVNIPGEACRLVVVDKLPFSVPTDPVVQAKSQDVESRGLSSFRDLAIPQMSLTLTQAFGRLIRTTDDKGVVAILDSRLTSSGWGQGIARSLPPAPRTSSLAEVRAFFETAFPVRVEEPAPAPAPAPAPQGVQKSLGKILQEAAAARRAQQS